MVRAILDGTKTQTRRIIKPQPDGVVPKSNDPFWLKVLHGDSIKCPYGKPGDRLWVRETWGDCTKGADIMAGTHWDEPLYRADADAYGLLFHDGLGPVYAEEILWRPSIHMPRSASRIDLEITGIRIERLQDINEEDAIAEGATYTDNGRDKYGQKLDGWSHTGETEKDKCLLSARSSFGNLWESINGEGSWYFNPFVWVVEFRKYK